jgi:hypothetical protein
MEDIHRPPRSNGAFLGKEDTPQPSTSSAQGFCSHLGVSKKLVFSTFKIRGETEILIKEGRLGLSRVFFGGVLALVR